MYYWDPKHASEDLRQGSSDAGRWMAHRRHGGGSGLAMLGLALGALGLALLADYVREPTWDDPRRR